MKIGAPLNNRETQDRREIFHEKVMTGRWYACVTSVDLRYFVSIIKTQGRFCTSLPIEFRRLGIKERMKKCYSATRTQAEKMILRAAAIRGENPPLLTVFDPAPAKPRRPVEKDPSKFPRPFAMQLKLPPDFQPRLSAKAEAPFVWAAEAAFQRIQESDVPSKGTAMLTYLAHVRVSNEVRSHTYRTHSIHLQKRAGLKESTVKKSNRELARIGLLFVHRGVIAGTAGNEVNAYTLGTAYPRGAEIGHSESDTSAPLNPSPRVPDDRGEPPSMYTYKERRIKTITRVSVPATAAPNRSLERSILAEIRAICGKQEMHDNGGLWTNLIRESADSLRAIKNAIEDWKLIRPDLNGGIKKTRGAFLMDRYKRSLAAIKQSNEDWKNQKCDSLQATG